MARHALRCCAHQGRRGYAVGLLHGPAPDGVGPLVREAAEAGVERLEEPALNASGGPGSAWRCLRALRRRVTAFGPELVHTHGGRVGAIGRVAAWRAGVGAIVHSAHEAPFGGRRGRLRVMGRLAVERYAARRCHRLIGLSQALCDAHLRRGVGRPEMWLPVPDGVEPAPFDAVAAARAAHAPDGRARLGLERAGPAIGVIGGRSPGSEPDEVLDLVPALRRRWPELEVAVIGDGRGTRRLRDRVAFSSLRESVRLPGAVDESEIPGCYGALDLVVLPARHGTELAPLAEAMCAGCCVVAYDASGLRELCVNGQTGRLAPRGDRRALRMAIEGLLARPAERRRLAESGRNFARERYGSAAMVTRIEDLYHELIRAGSPGEHPGS